MNALAVPITLTTDSHVDAAFLIRRRDDADDASKLLQSAQAK